MTEVIEVTDWMELPPRVVTTPVAGSTQITAASDSRPMWIPGDPFDVPQEPVLDDIRGQLLTQVAGDTNTVDTSLWRFHSTDNTVVPRIASSFDMQWISEGTVDIGALPVIDNDQNSPTQRFDLYSAALAAWEAEHPEAFATDVEWEGGTVTSPDHMFGTHTDRKLTIEHNQTVGVQTEFLAIDVPGGPVPDTGPPTDTGESEATLVIPPMPNEFGPLEGTYTPGSFYSTDLTDNYRGKPAEALGGPHLGSVGGFGGSGSILVADIDDATFDTYSQAVVASSDPTRYTRALVAWAVPDINSLWRFDQDKVVERQGVASVSSLFTPPRFRIRYHREVAAYRRTYPRDDSLAGGAGRNYPPSKATQSSNRTSGGYL